MTVRDVKYISKNIVHSVSYRWIGVTDFISPWYNASNIHLVYGVERVLVALLLQLVGLRRSLKQVMVALPASAN